LAARWLCFSGAALRFVPGVIPSLLQARRRSFISVRNL
jgi:hypothetical protein